MNLTRTILMDTQEEMGKEQKKDTPESIPSVKKSRESLFGTLLFTAIMVVILVLVLAAGWGGYKGFRANQEQTALPSIGNLAIAEQKTEVVEPEKSQEGEVKEEVITNLETELRTKAKNTDMKALNGGAAKGSAGVVAEILKKDGYTKVTPGNTLKDYTGTVVYYAAGLEKEAGFVKETLLKNYPKAEIKAAIPSNTETTQAPIVVIVGR